jgi:hypothetical protein
MPRFLTFDERTASTLRAQVPQQQVFEHGAADAVDYALGADRNIVAVMPTGAARQAAVAVFRKARVAARSPISARPAPKFEQRKPVASAPFANPGVAVRAGGFLGLRDEPVFEDDQPVMPKKQGWWRKLWPEDE